MPLVSTFGSLSARAFGLGAYQSTAFTPLSLFSGGVQGVWYDPSDLTTMFQDSAGTTPVGTPGNGSAQPVGLLLDKSQSGVGTNGAARYNFLTYTEDFTNAAWVSYNVTKTTSTITLTSTVGGAYEAPSGLVAGTYKFQCKIKAGTNNFAYLAVEGSTQTYASAVFDLINGTTGETRANGTGWSVSSSSISSLGSGWYLCSLIAVASSTIGSAPAMVVGFAPAATGNTWDGYGNPTGNTSGNTLNVKEADLRLNANAAFTPTYQPITSSWVATLAGNHATQSTASARPELSAKYNLLTYTEQFDNAAWNKYFTTITANTTTSPIGTSTADSLLEDSNTNYHSMWYLSAAAVSTNGSSYTFACYLKANGRTKGFLSVVAGGGFVTFDLTAATIAFGGNGTSETVTGQTITDAGSGWYKLTMTSSFSGARNITPAVGLYDANGNSQYTGDPTKGFYIWGADCRVTNDGVGLPAYQRVVDSLTYDSVGFPYYIAGNGVDRGMATSAFSLTSTSVASFFIGVRKFKDAINIPAELGDGGSVGNISLYPYNTAGWTLTVKGSDYEQLGYSTYAAPISNVIASVMTTTAANSAAAFSTRINAISVTGSSSYSSNSTGNFGTNALNLFRRSNGGYPSDARIYGLILRGATSSAGEISNTETWLNGKAKIY